MNRVLFLHSRLYAHLALQYGEPARRNVAEREQMTAFVNDELIGMVRLTRSAGAKLVLYFTPPLDRPFSETAASLSQSDIVLKEFAQSHGVGTAFVAHELVDRDYLALRLTPCCHFNADGHRALVPMMTRVVLNQLDGRPNEREPARTLVQ